MFLNGQNTQSNKNHIAKGILAGLLTKGARLKPQNLPSVTCWWLGSDLLAILTGLRVPSLGLVSLSLVGNTGSVTTCV